MDPTHPQPALSHPTDIWETALAMVKRHGALAPVECTLKADEMFTLGDSDGEAIWLAIRKVAQRLLENGLPADIPGLPSQ
jgi:hypothetical protein